MQHTRHQPRLRSLERVPSLVRHRARGVCHPPALLVSSDLCLPLAARVLSLPKTSFATRSVLLTLPRHKPSCLRYARRTKSTPLSFGAVRHCRAGGVSSPYHHSSSLMALRYALGCHRLSPVTRMLARCHASSLAPLGDESGVIRAPVPSRRAQVLDRPAKDYFAL